MNRNEFSSKVLATLKKRTNISQDGLDWLILALDPYHDNKRPVAGYPDSDNFATVVRNLNFQYTITKPAGAAGNWDACVFTLPFLSSQLFDAGNKANSSAKFMQTAENYTMDMVNVAKADAGEDLFPASPLAATNYSITKCIDLNNYQYGVARLIGLGIEAVDATAVVSKQGTVTCFSIPTAPTPGNLIYENTATTAIGPLPERHWSGWPNSSSDALVIPTTKQWEARKGAYMAVGFTGAENPFTEGEALAQTIYASSASTYGDCLVTQPTTVNAQAAPATTLFHSGSAYRPVPIPTAGMYFDGLHNDASILIRMRVTLEWAPRSDSMLVSLATPSAAYDIKALQLYSHIRSKLPIAVPVGENAGGDWWRRVLASIETFAPLIGNAMSPALPMAGIIGQTAGRLAGIVNQRAPKKLKDKKQSKKNGSHSEHGS